MYRFLIPVCELLVFFSYKMFSETSITSDKNVLIALLNKLFIYLMSCLLPIHHH